MLRIGGFTKTPISHPFELKMVNNSTAAIERVLKEYQREAGESNKCKCVCNKKSEFQNKQE